MRLVFLFQTRISHLYFENQYIKEKCFEGTGFKTVTPPTPGYGPDFHPKLKNSNVLECAQ